MIADIIAQETYIGVYANGHTAKLTVNVGRPYMDETKSRTVCPIEIVGLYENLSPIGGVNSYHALKLAMRTIHELLVDFVERGGKLYDEDDVDFTEPYGIDLI